MRRKNINIKMNIWYIILVLTLLLVDLVIILDLFLLRQILGFVFFTIIPGWLILQILKVNNLEFLKKIVLAIGLSISFLMFVGLLINSLHPWIDKPLSFYSVFVSLNLSVIILLMLTYLRNKNNFKIDVSDIYLKIKKEFERKLISPFLFSFLFPFMSVFGTYLMNTKGDNTILLIMLFLIPVYAAIITYLRDKIPEVTYPVAVWMTGLALSLTYGLRSNYVSLSDGTIEYFLFQQTLKSSYWEKLSTGVPSVDAYSACISVTILPVIYKIISNLQSFYIYKLYYNVILSITPIVVYIVSNKALKNSTEAFISSLFFISQYPYISMIGWIIFRQIPAILFFALIIMVLLENMSKAVKRFLFIVLVLSMVFSHYSTAYIFFIIIFIYFIITSLTKTRIKNIEIGKVNVTEVTLVFALIFFWYGQVSEILFKNFVESLRMAILTLVNLSLETLKSSGDIFIGAENIGYAITKYIYDMSLILIAVGTLTLLFELVRGKNNSMLYSFKLLTLISFSVLVPLILVGEFLKGRYGYDRVYQQLLLLLSPAFILGVKSTSKFFKINNNLYTFLLIIIVTLQFFASTYVILQFFGVHHSEVLNNDGIRYNKYYIKEIDATAAEWLYKYNEMKDVWSDYSGKFIYSQHDPKRAKYLNSKHIKNGYIYLRSATISSKTIYGYGMEKEELETLSEELLRSSKIYDSGANIYYTIPEFSIK